MTYGIFKPYEIEISRKKKLKCIIIVPGNIITFPDRQWKYDTCTYMYHECYMLPYFSYLMIFCIFSIILIKYLLDLLHNIFVKMILLINLHPVKHSFVEFFYRDSNFAHILNMQYFIILYRFT